MSCSYDDFATVREYLHMLSAIGRSWWIPYLVCSLQSSITLGPGKVYIQILAWIGFGRLGKSVKVPLPMGPMDVIEFDDGIGCISIPSAIDVNEFFLCLRGRGVSRGVVSWISRVCRSFCDAFRAYETDPPHLFPRVAFCLLAESDVKSSELVDRSKIES